jgi:hypothetical protein
MIRNALHRDANLDTLVRRIQAEFLEMPGLRLTLAEATRFWGIDPAACGRVIDVLVDRDFLRWSATGTIGRAE